MSTDSVSLNVNGLIFKSVQDVDNALKTKQITKKEAKAFKALFPKSEKKDLDKGVSVQESKSETLSPEQQATKDQAKQAAFEEVNKAKQLAASKEDKMAQVKNKSVNTDYGYLNPHGSGTAYTFDISAPEEHKTKITKDQERARMARYYDEKSGEWIERGEKYQTNKEVKQALKAKEKEIKTEEKTAKKDAKQLDKEAKQLKKEFLKYDAEIENLLASGLTMDQIKKEHTELWNKSYAAAEKYNELEDSSIKAVQKRIDAKEEREQVHQAKVASSNTGFLRKTGVGADKRAYNANVKANNRLADRVVVRTDAEKDRIKDSPDLEGKEIKVASDEDIRVLKSLSALAKKHMSDTSDPREKAIWKELANLTTNEGGHAVFNADTKQVQDALIDLTGGDMRLNYTEQQIIAKETGMSMSQVRSAFKTYGFEAPHPMGKRIVNGLIAAAPVAASMGLGYILSQNKAHASAHAEATAEDHAISDATQTTVVEGSVTATATTPGYKFDWTDPYTGEETHRRVAGATESATEYYKAVATANAHAEAHAKAFASVTAACEAVAKLSPYALYAAPVVAFIAGAAKPPIEKGATKAVKEEKLAEMVRMYTGNKNKIIGNQIIQMAGQITGDKATDRALITAVLRQDIGSQNERATTRELRNALAHLDAIKAEVDKFKKLPPEPEQKPEPEKPSPTPEPYCYDVKPGEVVKPNTHKVAKGDTIDMIIKAKYPDSDFRKAKAEFLKANPDLKDPNSIQIGQEFVLPDVDGKAPKMDGKVRQAHGKKIVFRPSKMPGVNGEQMFDVYDCSDPKNEQKLNNKPMTRQAAEAEQTRLSEAAQSQGRVPQK